MTLANKFVGMNIKKLSDQLPSGAVVVNAIEITDINDAIKAIGAIKKTIINSKKSILNLSIKI